MKQPKNLLLLALVAITLFGCIAMPRQTMPSEEANYHFTIKHSQSRSEAFNEVELALASAYNDLPRVLKLKQPDTGTFLLKPIVAYSNGPVRVQHAPYAKIVVSEHSVGRLRAWIRQVRRVAARKIHAGNQSGLSVHCRSDCEVGERRTRMSIFGDTIWWQVLGGS